MFFLTFGFSPHLGHNVGQIHLQLLFFSHEAMADSSRPHGTYPSRFLCPWRFSKQEYWSGLPFPPSGDLPNPGIEPGSPVLQADSLPSGPPRKPFLLVMHFLSTIIT